MSHTPQCMREDDSIGHEVDENTEIKFEDGFLVSTCTYCGREIFLEDMDNEYFKDSSEIVFLNWEVA